MTDRVRVSAVAAMTQNRVVGLNNDLPWDLPNDMKRFKDTTMGHAMIMGRKTYESMKGPLPRRANIVMTRQESYDSGSDRVSVVSHWDEAFAAAMKWENDEARGPSHEKEVFVIGGPEVWKLLWEKIDRIYLTVIHKDIDGDAYFPEFDWKEYDESYRQDFEEPVPYTFYTLDRKS